MWLIGFGRGRGFAWGGNGWWRDCAGADLGASRDLGEMGAQSWIDVSRQTGAVQHIEELRHHGF